MQRDVQHGSGTGEKKPRLNIECLVCGSSSHREHTLHCPAHININRDVLAFRGERDALSNYFPCKVNIFGQIFTSLEAAYQWRKATFVGRNLLAGKILKARNAREAKRLADEIPSTEAWEKAKVDVMQDILHAKFGSCAPYRNILGEDQQATYSRGYVT